jgi:hypothetical protein
MNALAMVRRCMAGQGPCDWAHAQEGPGSGHLEHSDLAVAASHQWEWPNLVIWSGSRHMVMLTVKE